MYFVYCALKIRSCWNKSIFESYAMTVWRIIYDFLWWWTVTDTAKITKVCGLHSVEENVKDFLEVSENKDGIVSHSN